MRQMRWIGVVGNADELLDEVVGSVQQRKLIICSHKNYINEKEADLSLCLVKRKLLKNMIHIN